MKYRATVMYVEIGCFVVCLLGWALVCSTLPTEYWNVSTLDQGVLTTSNFFSNLWKDCVSDSTGVSDCKEFPSLLALDLNIHMCRALVIMAIILSFFGAVLSLVGMKCTKIGGSDVASTRVTFAAGINNMVAGFCAMIAYSWYGNKIRKEFVNPNFKGAKFEIGAALFVGWGGSSLLIIGGFIFSFFAKKEGLRCRYGDAHREPAAPAFSSWPKTHHFDSSVPFSPRTPVPFRPTLQLEPTSCTPARTRRTTIISLPLKEVSEGRKTRTTTTLSRAPTDTYV